MEQFGERVSIFYSFGKLLKIHIRNGELVADFNIRFARVLNETLENCILYDKVCLVFYFGAFDGKTSYLLGAKKLRALYQEFMTTMDTEYNMKYGLTRSNFVRNVFQYDAL